MILIHRKLPINYTFADASTVSYDHGTYLRLVKAAKQVHVALLSGKAKVAPMRPVSWLKLQAAASAVRLVTKYIKELDISNISTHFYSDSTVILDHISNTADNFHTYIANRVETIRHLLDPDSWKHVPTAENPAHYSFRGANVKEIGWSDCFSGPRFPRTKPSILPTQLWVYINPKDVEIKQSLLSFISEKVPFSLDKRLEKFSD